MIVQRLVFQAKYGKANELVALLKRGGQVFEKLGYHRGRVLTDISGPMFTIVWENEFRSLAAWERARSKIFAAPEFGQWFAKMQDVVERGSREFWNVE